MKEEKGTEIYPFDFLMKGVQRRIERRMIRVIVPPILILMVVTLIAHLVLYPSMPTRLLPGGVLLCSLAGVWGLHKGRLDRAATFVFSGVVFCAIMLGMTFNGGLLAPITMGGVAWIGFLGWLYGQRMAVAATFVVILSGAFFWWGHEAGLLPEAQPSSPRRVWFTMVPWALAMMLATVIPSQMMRRALKESESRREEVEAVQREKERSTAAFQAVFDHTYQYMALLDPEGRVLRLNKTALALLNAPEEKALGKAFDALFKNAVDASAHEQVAEAIRVAVQGERFKSQTTLVHQGQKLVLDFSLSPFFGEDGKAIYLIAEARDVTDFVEAQKRLGHSQKMEAIGQLAGGVAHDFNNMLGGILGAAELLSLQAHPDDREQTHLINTILTAGERAADLTHKLLVFGRKNAPVAEEVSFHQSLTSALLILERTLGPRVLMQRDILEGDPVVIGDACAIENAVVNLAINARDAMPQGGTLHISTAMFELDEAWCAASPFEVEPGRSLRLSVRDTGTGMPREVRDRIFEPFFTTKPEGKGTGLGLASVFSLMVEMGGALQVYSEEGEGTVFHLFFPLHGVERAPEGEKSSLLERYEGKRILVIDDEPLMRSTSKLLLEELGFEVDVAEGGELGVEIFLARPGRYECVLVDIIMPGMRGTEVFARVRAADPEIPVILTSGFPREEDVHSLRDERSAFLHKPFNLARLSRLLRDCLGPSLGDASSAEKRAATHPVEEHGRI